MIRGNNLFLNFK